MTSRTNRQLAGTGFALFAALAMTTAIGTQALAGSDSHAAAKDAKHEPAHAAKDGHAKAKDNHAKAKDGHAKAKDGHAKAKDSHAKAKDGSHGKSHGKVAAKAAKAEASHGKKSHGGHGKWSYDGATGPDHWGELSKDFEACGRGAMQSPIDLSGGFGASGEPITFNYRLTALNIEHNGHTVKVNYAPGSSMSVGGKQYELLEFQFHTPSEHAVDHKQTAMELQLVHQSADGEWAVVGIMLEVGEVNIALREIWGHMPRKAGPAKSVDQVALNARDFLPQDQSYYRYMGSLTTPPCTEGVNWYVMTQPVSVSADQVALLAKAVGHNNRPVQDVNHRLVLAPNGNSHSSH